MAVFKYIHVNTRYYIGIIKYVRGDVDLIKVFP